MLKIRNLPKKGHFLRECKERYNKLFIKKLFDFPKFENQCFGTLLFQIWLSISLFS